MPTYRIQPSLNDVPRLMKAESAEAATARVLRITGYETVDSLNHELYDGGPDNDLEIIEVSPDYLAALAVICRDPAMQDLPDDVLHMRQPWEPAPETLEAIRKAVDTSGATSPRHACNMIMWDMRDDMFDIPTGDWSWVPMMKLVNPEFLIERANQR